uniref:Uncharacterized protein n=1 Tax=Picea glauca TaxID=3330 RepID=A0A101LVA3_PICGL|nr:hypothetical protein ABT39_MTgene2102 [Picea glauca]QHR86935.1 hypothetical protein Q903MT_gene942 [Picea sitchensis]
MLLRRNWFYYMCAIVFLVFRLLKFPHHDHIITIDQLPSYTLLTTPNMLPK